MRHFYKMFLRSLFITGIRIWLFHRQPKQSGDLGGTIWRFFQRSANNSEKIYLENI